MTTSSRTRRGNTVIVDRGWNNMVGRTRGKRLQGMDLVIGFFDGAGSSIGITKIAEYAFFNEYGTKHIPERAFFRTVIDANEAKYLAMIQKIKPTSTLAEINGFLVRLGNEVKNDVVKSIIDWSSPPNAPNTIKQKGSSNPLVDTMTMTRAVSFEVRQK